MGTLYESRMDFIVRWAEAYESTIPEGDKYYREGAELLGTPKAGDYVKTTWEAFSRPQYVDHWLQRHLTTINLELSTSAIHPAARLCVLEMFYFSGFFCSRIGGIDAANKYYPARGPCTVEQLTTGIFLPNPQLEDLPHPSTIKALAAAWQPAPATEATTNAERTTSTEKGKSTNDSDATESVVPEQKPATKETPAGSGAMGHPATKETPAGSGTLGRPATKETPAGSGTKENGKAKANELPRTIGKKDRAPTVTGLRMVGGRPIPFGPVRSQRHGKSTGLAPQPDRTILARTMDPRQAPRKLRFDSGISPSKPNSTIDVQATGLPKYSFECTSFNAYSAFVGKDNVYLLKFQALFKRCTIYCKRLPKTEMEMPENSNVKLVIWAIPNQGLQPDLSTLAEITGLLRGLAIWSRCYYWNCDRNGTIRIDEFAEDYPYVFAPANESELSDAAPPATPVWNNATAASAAASFAGPSTIGHASTSAFPPLTTSAVVAPPKPTAPQSTIAGPSRDAPPPQRVGSGTMMEMREAQAGTTYELAEQFQMLGLASTRLHLKAWESGEKKADGSDLRTMFNILKNQSKGELIRRTMELVDKNELIRQTMGMLDEEELAMEVRSRCKQLNLKYFVSVLYPTSDKEKKDALIKSLNE